MKTGVIGLPKGSLLQATIELLKKVGIIVKMNGRSFLADVEGSSIFSKAFITRPKRLPSAMAKGKIDAYFIGVDLLVELGLEGSVKKIVELAYSKASRRQARVVVFSKNYDTVMDEENITVLTEYPNLTKRTFKKAKIEISDGSTEADVAIGSYDYGVCVVESGRSIEDNGLKILKTIIVSSVALIAREASSELKTIGKMLEGALMAESYQLVKFNADMSDKESLVGILPALEAPTISNLSDGAIAIETVVSREVLTDTVIAIKLRGGRNILIQDINVSV